ncbi:hypothetical protein BGX28_008205 [Mortierella sp. GBA30]|nr:hypothetical protein BGX28_008205 [Mortierella sp. GBA30]
MILGMLTNLRVLLHIPQLAHRYVTIILRDLLTIPMNFYQQSRVAPPPPLSSSSSKPYTGHSRTDSGNLNHMSAAAQEPKGTGTTVKSEHHRPIKPEHSHAPPRRVSTHPEDQRPARIKIVQQPLHARMCGFGEKDRRPIDPPPIVQLLLDEEHEQHPTKRMQRSAASAAAKLNDKNNNNNKSNKSGLDTAEDDDDEESSHDEQDNEDEDETYQLDEDEDGDEDRNEGSSKRGSVKTTRGRAGSIRKASLKAASTTTSSSSSPSLGKRGRHGQSESSTTKVKPSSHSGSDVEDQDQDGEDDDHDDLGQLKEQDPLFVLHVSLWSHDGKEVRNMIATPGQSEPPKLTRILMGSLVVSPVLLNNAEGVPGWYFSFPDLSIRTEGVYTLKFSLMRFGSFDFLNNEDGHASTLVAEEISEPFTVFSAKKFPGMTESTELSKAFAKQGLKIPIRNDLRIRKADKE